MTQLFSPFLQTTQLRSELVSCTEERDDLNQSLGQWREKVYSLEKSNCDTRNLISILEDDIRAGRKEYEALQSSMEKLKTERQQVCMWKIQEIDTCRLGESCIMLRNVHESIHSFPLLPLKLLEQIKALEQAVSQQSGEREELIGQLDKITEDHTSAYENTESMVGKIQVRGIVI